MKNYDGWSLRDRSFLWALAMSVLWHFFWFFSITVTVTPNKYRFKPHTKVVSLGPVLDDTIFRALVENKPQLSETFYRRLSDFASPTEPEARTLERRAAGEVVSLPFGKKIWNSMRILLGGVKAAPDEDFGARLNTGFSGESFHAEGGVANRGVISRPEQPELPVGSGLLLRDSETELGFFVTSAGEVKNIETLSSSGDPDIDLLWIHYLQGWQFSPLDVDRPELDQYGKIRFRFGRHPEK